MSYAACFGCLYCYIVIVTIIVIAIVIAIVIVTASRFPHAPHARSRRSKVNSRSHVVNREGLYGCKLVYVLQSYAVCGVLCVVRSMSYGVCRMLYVAGACIVILLLLLLLLSLLLHSVSVSPRAICAFTPLES